MSGKCICETGEELSMGGGMSDTSLRVFQDDGDWTVEVSHPDNYAPDCYWPVYHCPICGRELK